MDLPLWAVEPDARPWDYALLTGTSSIQHSLRCGARLGERVGELRPEWIEAADVMAHAVRTSPDAFEPKTRWAMDWYYPVLTGVLTGEAAKARLAEGWETFAMEGLGIRCVSDEPWITASETAECALAYASMGDMSTATDLLMWTRTHRRDDGSYWTGIVYPEPVLFPFDEHTSYTAAAVVLAVDAITRATPASDVFVPFCRGGVVQSGRGPWRARFRPPSSPPAAAHPARTRELAPVAPPRCDEPNDRIRRFRSSLASDPALR